MQDYTAATTIVPDSPATRRIAHIKGHIADGFNLPQLIRNIEGNLGDPQACLMLLSGHAEACAMLRWFVDHDLAAMRQWFYVGASLNQKLYQSVTETHSPGAKMLALLNPLLSNDRGLIEWYSHWDRAYDSTRIDNTHTRDFWAYQAIVALRGDWERLGVRCRMVLRDPPQAKSEQKYLVDHKFYLALSQGDVQGMEAALTQITTPQPLRTRKIDESGFTGDLISKPAVIYSKIAWCHGYEVKPNADCIPHEWLPMTPSNKCKGPYSFID